MLLADTTRTIYALRRLEIELMTLGAIVFRLGVLVMAQVAIQFRSVMRRSMRIGRFDIFCFFDKLGRAAVTGDALLHGQRFRFFGLSVAADAIDAHQLMNVAARQFADQIMFVLGMTGLACRPSHGLGIDVLFRQLLFLAVAGGTITALEFRLFHFGCGPNSLAQNHCHHKAE